MRIGVLREYMDPKALGVAASNSTALVEQGIEKLRALGAEIVDPGAGGELFGTCIASYAPALMNTEFVERYPKLMDGKDQIEAFLDLAFTPEQVPEDLTLRSFSNGRWDGERKYMFNRYLRERGDAAIKTNADLINKANFYADDRFPDRKAARQQAEDETKLDSAARAEGPLHDSTAHAAMHAAPGPRRDHLSDERDAAREARRARQRRRRAQHRNGAHGARAVAARARAAAVSGRSSGSKASRRSRCPPVSRARCIDPASRSRGSEERERRSGHQARGTDARAPPDRNRLLSRARSASRCCSDRVGVRSRDPPSHTAAGIRPARCSGSARSCRQIARSSRVA